MFHYDQVYAGTYSKLNLTGDNTTKLMGTHLHIIYSLKKNYIILLIKYGLNRLQNSLQENSGILTDIPMENEILGYSDGK